MKKLENKLSRPLEMSEVDRLKLALAGERSARARTQFEMVIAQENDLRAALMARYKMTPSDTVDLQTGTIVRGLALARPEDAG